MVEYDPFSEALMTDPHPVYQRLRDEAPAYYLPKYDCWALSRFEDIWSALLDTKSYSVAGGTASPQILTKVQPVTPMIATMDPPDHSRLRTVFRPFFSPARVKELEPELRAYAGRLFDEMLEAGGGDLVWDFGMRMATQVASMIAGFPAEDGAMLYGLVQRFNGDAILKFVIFIPHPAPITDHIRHRSIDNNIVGHMKVCDSFTGVHHG